MFFNREKSKKKKASKQLVEAVKKGSIQDVKQSLENGADPDYLGWESYHPLTLSINQNKIEIAELLLENGADINIQGDYGTPLHALCNLDVEKTGLNLLRLSKNDINPNALDQQEDTPLHYAARNNHFHLVRKLVKAGANVNAIDTPWQDTPIFNAAYEGNFKIVKYLFKHGAELDYIRVDGNSLLMNAISSPTAAPELIHFLLREGSDIDQINDAQEKAIHIACKKEYSDEYPSAEEGKELIIFFLLMYGADPNIASDINGNRPIDYVSDDDFILAHLFAQAKKIQEEGFELLTSLGAAALQMKRYNAAYDFLNWALVYDEEDADANYFMSVLLLDNDEEELGMEYLVKAAQHGSKDALTFMNEMGISFSE